MHKADITTRAVSGFVDLLLVIGLAWLPDILGFLSATGYILIRDGLFAGQSLGKKLIGLRVTLTDEDERAAGYRESIIRNIPFALAYMLFLIPYVGWILAALVLAVECLSAVGDEKGMRIGDLLARTHTRQAAAAWEKEPEISQKTGQQEPKEVNQDFEI